MEKDTEYNLRRIFDEYNIPSVYRYSSISQNADLKSLFSKASKSNTQKSGHPDYIYYDRYTLMVFECKHTDLQRACSEAQFYVNSLHELEHHQSIKHIYCCGFVNANLYEIYEYRMTDGNFAPVKNITLDALIRTLVISPVSFSKSSMFKDIHTIHDYIRDHTKISNEDKSLFIGGLLVALRERSFVDLVKSASCPDLSYALIHKLRAFNITNLDSIYTDSLHNIHLLNIAQLLYNITKNNPNIDLLNDFYREFVSYQNTDSKSLGIVLTPDHIAKLMIKLLNINKNDIFLDLCSGTGSFSCNAVMYDPAQIICCEYQKKLYDLLQINSILHGGAFKCIHSDCFVLQQQSVSATKSAINPPYGMKDKTELDFVIKQAECLKIGGFGASIIPSSCFTVKKYVEKRNKIASLCRIKKIITCNNKVFYPTAGVQTCILLMERCQNGHSYDDDRVEFIDYTDDGIEIKKHVGKIYNDTFTTKYDNVLTGNTAHSHHITKLGEWKYQAEATQSITEQSVAILQLEAEFAAAKIKLLSAKTNEIPAGQTKHRLCDIFDIKRGTVQKGASIDGQYPLIGASKCYNGVIKMIDTFAYENCITIATNGSVGEVFYHPYKFNATADVCVLLPKPHFQMTNPYIICARLRNIGKNYSYGYKWTSSKIKDEELYI